MLTQLATERLQILNNYDGTEKQLDRLIAVEAEIVASPRGPEADAIKIDILSSDDADFADLFIKRLAKSLK